MSRTPRSRFYDGRPYAWLLDPFLAGLHGFVAGQVPPGSRVLDVGCGTGDLALRLADHAEEVVGVELSPSMVTYARASATGRSNVSFVLGDASSALSAEDARSFDYATAVLTLHEMPTAARARVLAEAARLARRVLCVDFRADMPRNLAGLRNRFFELAAGLEHFRAYRDFAARGGIAGIAQEAGLEAVRLRYVDGDTLDVVEVRRP